MNQVLSNQGSSTPLVASGILDVPEKYSTCKLLLVELKVLSILKHITSSRFGCSRDIHKFLLFFLLLLLRWSNLLAHSSLKSIIFYTSSKVISVLATLLGGNPTKLSIKA